jgi:hypothetical protein
MKNEEGFYRRLLLVDYANAKSCTLFVRLSETVTTCRIRVALGISFRSCTSIPSKCTMSQLWRRKHKNAEDRRDIEEKEKLVECFHAAQLL